LVEGDVKNFDMTVKAVFVNLYFSSMLIHEDPTHPDYPMKELIIKALIRAILARITHFLGEIWGIQRGGVPSGCYNTSHMDSWVMALYFFLFVVYQIMNAPPEHQVELEEVAIKILRIVVYGDDHAYNKGMGPSAAYFSGEAFAKFMWDKFDVVIRDIKDGTCFCSRTYNGWLVDVGLTFLKHQFVENHSKELGQSKFLPFRETREYMGRAVWGRESKVRDVVDVCLSVLGHAFGTHGSNYDAYKSLMFFYEELLRFIPGTPDDQIGKIMDRVSKDDLGKWRQHGITVEELRSGFPTWDVLTKRNRFDAAYQDITKDLVDVDMELQYA